MELRNVCEENSRWDIKKNMDFDLADPPDNARREENNKTTEYGVFSNADMSDMAEFCI